MSAKTTSTALIKAMEVRKAAERMPCLLFVSGLDAGRLLALNFDRGPLIIGREDEVDLRLDGPEISRHHATLERDDQGRIVITDHDSKNGIFVNDRRVDQAEIRADDKLRIGPYFVLKLTFQDEEEINFARELYKRAISDPLTGIINRQFFSSNLEREWSFASRHGQTLSLAMFDLDRFKVINDALGHQAGDEVLREFVRRLQQNTRLEDLIGRYGGEEFIILFRETDIVGAVAVAERIRQATAEKPFRVFADSIQVTVSAGIACFTHDQIRLRRPESLIREADKRLYVAKSSGRNCVVGEPE